MKKLLSIVLCWAMVMPAWAVDGSAVVGPVKVVGPSILAAPPQCGAGILGADIYGSQAGCGNTGNAYFTEGGSQSVFRTGASSVNTSACPTALSSSTKYYLTGNITCAGATAFTISPGTQVDLGGFTVDCGAAMCFSRNGDYNGASIFNGTVACSLGDGVDSATGCIRLVSDGVNVSSSARLHHLTIANSNASANNAFDIYLEYTTATNANLIPAVLIFNNSLSLTANNSSSRNDAIRITGSNSGPTAFTVFNNRIECGNNSNACNGIENTNSKLDKYFNNYIICDLHSGGSAVASCRGATCDGNTLSSSDLGCEVMNNRFDVNDGRAIRYRSRLGSAHDNLVVGMTSVFDGGGGQPLGAIHIYDQDQAVAENYAGLLIYNNNFKNSVSGNAVYGIAGLNARISGFTTTGTVGTAILAYFTAAAIGGNTTAQLCNDAIFNTPNITANQSGGTTTIGATSSGTGTGTGTVNAGTCPQAGNP